MTRRGRRVFSPAVFFALLSLVLAVALYLKSCPGGPGSAPKPPPPFPPRPLPTWTRPVPPPVRPTRVPERTREPAAAPRRVAIVIDDLGNDLGPAERIAAWPGPVAGAVLPGLRWSAASARVLSRAGKEVLLHLPMEPAGYPKVRPGPGVILRAQSDEDIVRTIEKDLDSVPGVVGVNNHMGSAATADPRVMRAVARVLAGRGLYFLDSRTTDATVAERAAEQAAVPSARRRVFLDDVATESAVNSQLEALVRMAREQGGAIAIGHPYPVTLSVLERRLPGLSGEGVKLVRVADLVK